MYTHIHIYTHMCIYIYIYIHTYIYIYILREREIAQPYMLGVKPICAANILPSCSSLDLPKERVRRARQQPTGFRMGPRNYDTSNNSKS